MGHDPLAWFKVWDRSFGLLVSKLFKNLRLKVMVRLYYLESRTKLAGLRELKTPLTLRDFRHRERAIAFTKTQITK
jgi:hypothetical protein